ncbi:hypothetical protein V501_02027 [Pseudogymnoascus sp. VKM F-4519 (FW-2642)]|nr:hypothetical protein V501_02027 [Pseudogymnoascus sp. VKM F-4519 (FW-2642)]
MARPDPDEDSELNNLNTSDVDKAVKSVVRWLRNENTTRYFENHPVARDAILTAVREVTHSTALATPTSTPYNSHTSIGQALTPLSSPSIAHEESDQSDQTSTLLLPLHIAQAKSGDFNDSTDLQKIPRDAPDQTSPAAQQELENGSQPPYYSSIEHGDTLDSEHATNGSQHCAGLEASTPAEHNDVSDNDAHPNGLPFTQTPTSLVQYRSNTARDQPRKRKHNSEGCGKFKQARIGVTDTTDAELGDKSLECSKQITSQPVPIRDEQFGQHPEMLEGAQDTQLSIAVTPPALPEAAVTSRHSSEPPSATELPEGESDRFTKLPADLRAKLRMIGDESTLAAIMDYVNYTANPPPSADYCADTLEDYQGPDSTSDQRFRVLRNRIVRDEAEEEIVKNLRVNFRTSKLFALAELSIRYTEEKDSRSAVSKKRRKKELPQELPRLSPRGLLTDLLFPEIGNIEGEEERNNAREAAKGKFSYWITLGDPLAELAKRFGSLILLILPESLTISDLHKLNRHHIQDFVDYIDFIHPGLKEKVINLSGILLQKVDASRPAQRQLLDILTSNLLSESINRPPEELLLFANHPSKSDLAQAVASPSFDQPYANNQLSHPQRIGTSVEGIHVDIENSQWQPPGAGPSASLGNSDEQSTRYITDYFSQDGDWREQSHFSDHEREFLDSQNSSLQQSGPGEENLFDINSYVNFSPPNTPSIASPSSSQYRGQDLLAHLVDMPRASTPLQNLNKSTNNSPLASELHIKQPAVNIWQDTGMPDLGKIWNAHGQENRTVNPRDLLQTPVQNYSTVVDDSTVQDYSTGVEYSTVQDYSTGVDDSTVQDYSTGVEYSTVQDYSTGVEYSTVQDYSTGVEYSTVQDYSTGVEYSTVQDYSTGVEYSTVQDYSTGVEYSTVQDYSTGVEYSTVQDYSTGVEYSTVQDYSTGVEYSTVQDYSTGVEYSTVQDYSTGVEYSACAVRTILGGSVDARPSDMSASIDHRTFELHPADMPQEMEWTECPLRCWCTWVLTVGSIQWILTKCQEAGITAKTDAQSSIVSGNTVCSASEMAHVRDTTADAANDLLGASQKFLASYRLLSRWQRNLEFYLFAFCRINNPQIIVQCNWPCHEAAELTRLSKKIKEHCSHHTRDFEKSGISVDEREHFYTELQEIRKLRNTVVHREVVDAATIERYKGSALGVLQIVRRLGGKDFEEAYGKSLDHLLHSFCEVESAPEAVVSYLYPLNIRCGQGIKTAMEEQISARRRRAINIDKMMEDFQVAQEKRAANQQRALQQKEDADKAKAERAQKARDREKEAEQTRIEAKRERACKAEALRMAAEEKKRIRQHKQAQIRAAADEP